MPFRAFIDSDTERRVLPVSRKPTVLMPFRAFIDSDRKFEEVRQKFLEVLMPFRAFIDSDIILPANATRTSRGS